MFNPMHIPANHKHIISAKRDSRLGYHKGGMTEGEGDTVGIDH